MRLLKENEYQRFYQLDFKVKKYGNGQTIAELFKHDPIKLMPEYELAEELSSINKVCISDAHTHIERLCFPAFYVLNKETGETKLVTRCNTICGVNTFMSHGGSYRRVYDDRTYVRLLKIWNKTTNNGETNG